jgi:VWFA-related protein
MSGRRQLWTFCLCASLTTVAAAQLTTQPASTNLSSSSRQITIDVNVTDEHGKLVAGLQQQDFTLLDGKQPLSITSFQQVSDTTPATPPARAILVLDTVNTSFETLSRERNYLQKFFLQNGGRLPIPISLVIFSYSGLNQQQGASTDGNVELDFLNRNPIAVHSDNRAQGEPGQFDRIERSLAALRSLAVGNLNAPGRKLLIWVSPGWPVPMESTLGLTPKEKRQVFNRIVVTSGLLLVSRITLYSVDPLGTDDAGSFLTSRYKNYMGEIKNPTQPQVANLALQIFALHSGGRAFSGSNDIAGELNDCIADASAYYTLSFTPPRADHPNEYHHLEIKIDKPGLKARTRSGYYLQP